MGKFMDSMTPVKATIVGTSANYTTKTKKGLLSTASRGLVGGALFGPVGGIIGASTAKSKSTTKVTSENITFLVEYANGRKATETVKVNSLRYQMLCQLLED